MHKTPTPRPQRAQMQPLARWQMPRRSRKLVEELLQPLRVRALHLPQPLPTAVELEGRHGPNTRVHTHLLPFGVGRVTSQLVSGRRTCSSFVASMMSARDSADDNNPAGSQAPLLAEGHGPVHMHTGIALHTVQRPCLFVRACTKSHNHLDGHTPGARRHRP